MKNTIVLSALLFAVSSQAALTADLYLPEAPIEIIEGSADWSGAYVGAQFGGQGVRILAPQTTPEGMGAIAGVYAGANFQTGNFVYGGEADLEYSSFNHTAPCGTVTWTCNDYLNVQGSLRARFGYAVDALLFYGTAGVAVANSGGSTTSPTNVTFSDSAVRVGWTAGVGAEAALSDHWVGRLEYRYTDLGSRDMMFDMAYRGVKVSSHAIRAGIGYKF